MLDIQKFIDYREKVNPDFEAKQFVQDLELATAKDKKNGRAFKRVVKPFDLDMELFSWKFNEWDYSKPELKLASYARGLFTTEDRVVVRGYDKFFNIDEVAKTKLAALKEATIGPYEVTLKTNGCIIVVSAIEDGTLIVCSKHSTGYRTDQDKNHSLQGKIMLEKQLRDKNIDPKEFGKILYRLNVTAVAEYCDDEFEEHVIAYNKQDSGLYLHSLNFNTPKFICYPFEYVDEFSRYFGFRTTDYFVEPDFDALMAYLEKSAETGTYEGIEVEGFVIRCKNLEHDDLLWKFKFDEPYLMYRTWREGCKMLSRIGDLTDPKFKRYNETTMNYLRFCEPILKDNPLIARYYLSGHGIVGLRKLYLNHIGKNGMEVLQGDSHAVESADLKKDIDQLISELAGLAIEPTSETLEKDQDSLITTKYVFIPIATIGCGKTTVALTLEELFGWGLVQLDNIKSSATKNKLELLALRYLAGSTDALKEENLNKTSESGFTKVLENNTVIIDRNNHMYRERKQIMGNLIEWQHKYLPKELDGMPLKYKFKFIALNFLDVPGKQKQDIRGKLWDVTHGRVVKRGENHQSIKYNEESSEKLDNVMNGFITRFQSIAPNKSPDNRFDVVIDLDIFQDNSSRKNVDTVIRVLQDRIPEIFSKKPLPTSEQIDAAFEKALKYKPTIVKFSKSKTAEKKTKVAYYGLKVPEASAVVEKVESLLAKNHADSSLYYTLKADKRIQSAFHVTLCHANDKAKKNIMKYYHTLLKGVVVKKPETVIKKNAATVELDKLLWDDKGVCISLKPIELPAAAEHTHITLGTVLGTKPVYSNELIRKYVAGDPLVHALDFENESIASLPLVAIN